MNILSRKLINLGERVDRLVSSKGRKPPPLRAEFSALTLSGHAMQSLLDNYDFETVLDIGTGAGEQAEVFIKAGRKVTAIDYGQSAYFRNNAHKLQTIVADFNEHKFSQRFDCVWCSHVLEHQLNPHSFLVKVHDVLKEGGVLAITVPPLKHEIVGGHVSVWNVGLLLYRLVLAGFDCKDAGALCYGYNFSVIVKKRSINVLNVIEYDTGDIRKIRPFLPSDLPFAPNQMDDAFDGNIYELNWRR